ncbi:flagellar brake protein [Vibrio sp. S9_S30]|uniref:flagellar brake protein n=1 Tax=Vibrio sp. S9_S30 TaxID=2720226 RepID=UPI001680E2AD|nr:flagellar brake protein [Vibrio sp. S9_S30]MBD1556364.1 flagellar brake protein [Vibrio sp. S9_S30]
MADNSATANLQSNGNKDNFRGAETTLKSSDALAMIEHSSEATINVSTPVGINYKGTTPFIGTIGTDYILLGAPDISDEDYEYFFQEGFWVNVRAISPRGEGALIYFRCQIMHIINNPVRMIMISIPANMKVLQLRKEPRYDVSLAAIVFYDGQRLECEVRDISKGGCRIITSPLTRTFQIGEAVQVSIVERTREKLDLPQLTGKICNMQKSHHYARYGMMFDDKGEKSVQLLLSHLKFDGSKLALKA